MMQNYFLVGKCIFLMQGKTNSLLKEYSNTIELFEFWKCYFQKLHVLWEKEERVFQKERKLRIYMELCDWGLHCNRSWLIEKMLVSLYLNNLSANSFLVKCNSVLWERIAVLIFHLFFFQSAVINMSINYLIITCLFLISSLLKSHKICNWKRWQWTQSKNTVEKLNN